VKNEKKAIKNWADRDPSFGLGDLVVTFSNSSFEANYCRVCDYRLRFSL